MSIIILALCIWGLIALLKSIKKYRQEQIRQKNIRRAAEERERFNREAARLRAEWLQQQNEARERTRRQIEIEKEKIHLATIKEQEKQRKLAETDEQEKHLAEKQGERKTKKAETKSKKALRSPRQIIEPYIDQKLDYIELDGLSEQKIEREKKRLIDAHVSRALTGLDFPASKSEKEIASTRIFFVDVGDRLVLCGVYKVNDKYDKLDEQWSMHCKTYDYLLFSKTAGFFFLKDCGEPTSYQVEDLNYSPSIYYQSDINIPYAQIEYGKTYKSEELQNIQTKYCLRTYKTREQSLLTVRAYINTNLICEYKNVALYSELPLVPDWFVISKQPNKMRWHLHAQLINFTADKSFPILCMPGGGLPFNYYTTLSVAVVSREIKEYQVVDDENYYFYVSKSDTVAFDILLRCVNMVGKMHQLKNLLDYDSTVNYKITVPKQTSPDMINFILGVIIKSKVLFPSILGCPVHDIVTLLCNDCERNPYRQPYLFDTISAENAISLLKRQFENLSNWELVNLIVSHYGSYAAVTRAGKHLAYHAEGLNCDYLPPSVGPLIGEVINGDFVDRLEKKNYSTKWISEYSLYLVVLAYYPDAKMHYYPEWLGQQHLDIYIPSLLMGIEYHGQQHYEASDYFGGEAGFLDRQILDEKKKKLCKENHVQLVEWPYTTPVSTANFLSILLSSGIEEIPIPDPFRVPSYREEDIPEEKISFCVRQFSLDGSLVCSYSSYQEAAEASGVSLNAILKAVYGYSKTAGGFQWRKDEDGSLECGIEPVKETNNSGVSKPVFQVSLDGEVIAEYTSISQAAKATGINSKSISLVLRGVQKTAGNYYWVQKEN